MAKVLPVIKTQTIGAYAKAQLMIVVAENEQKNAIGLSYNDVLRLVRDEFPECKTTVKCLQWYNSDLKRDDEIVPIRPRFSTLQYLNATDED